MLGALLVFSKYFENCIKVFKFYNISICTFKIKWIKNNLFNFDKNRNYLVYFEMVEKI